MIGPAGVSHGGFQLVEMAGTFSFLSLSVRIPDLSRMSPLLFRPTQLLEPDARGERARRVKLARDLGGKAMNVEQRCPRRSEQDENDENYRDGLSGHGTGTVTAGLCSSM